MATLTGTPSYIWAIIELKARPIYEFETEVRVILSQEASKKINAVFIQNGTLYFKKKIKESHD